MGDTESMKQRHTQGIDIYVNMDTNSLRNGTQNSLTHTIQCASCSSCFFRINIRFRFIFSFLHRGRGCESVRPIPWCLRFSLRQAKNEHQTTLPTGSSGENAPFFFSAADASKALVRCTDPATALQELF